MSGTEAIELLRQFLGAADYEFLPDCARRVLHEYLTTECRTMELTERAIVADTLFGGVIFVEGLPLDAIADDRLMLWSQVFAAADMVRGDGVVQ